MGHRVIAAYKSEIQIESERYPFCATGESDKDSNIRPGMTLTPFNQELNRFVLVMWSTSFSLQLSMMS